MVCGQIAAKPLLGRTEGSLVLASRKDNFIDFNSLAIFFEILCGRSRMLNKMSIHRFSFFN